MLPIHISTMHGIGMPQLPSPRLQGLIQESLKVIDESFKQYGNNVSICYNGGKDSTIMLDLITKYAKINNYTVTPFYLETDDDFPEILDFIHASEDHWGVQILYIKSSSLKDGLQKLVDEYNVKAVFLGVRATDIKNVKMEFFEKTTPGWPNSMRIMPFLNWSYSDVWEYIDFYGLPYCSLYAQGYTSIGSRYDTEPNPLLKDPVTSKYLHARMLSDLGKERMGRGLHHE